MPRAAPPLVAAPPQNFSPEQLAFLERKAAQKAPTNQTTHGQTSAHPSDPRAVPTPPAHWLIHAPPSYFAWDQLDYKGKRKNVDVGDPEDYSRPLAKGLASGTTSCGSWACTEGGWDSPTKRPTTEWFFVMSGAGAVTDPDGTRHDFGPGDVVVLPKGWYGRWDVTHKIHKVWVIHDHDEIPGFGSPTPVVAPLSSFAAQFLEPSVGKTPNRLSKDVFDNGRMSCGYWSCEPGHFAVPPRATTEVFHVLSGMFFLTNADGSARRCTAGDTVVLPAGWSGHWDIIETVQKVWVDIDV